MGRFLKFLAVSLPLAGFVWLVLWVRQLMDQGQGMLAAGCLLGGVAALALVEGLLFKFWILPAFAASVGERFYGGSYVPADDALVVLAERIRREKSRELLPELERRVRSDPRRVRGWLEYANVLHEVFADDKNALETLRLGAKKTRAAEDRAMLLCRAAHLASDALRDEPLSRKLYEEAATRYPSTTYGKLAASRLG